MMHSKGVFFEISPFWKSFYSSTLFRKVAYEWQGLALFYLLGIVLITSLVLSVDVYFNLHRKNAKEIPIFFSQLPDFQIKDGLLETPEIKKYAVILSEGKPPLVIMDASAEKAPLDLEGAKVYVTKNKMLVRGNERKITPYNLAEIQKTIRNKSDLEKWIHQGVRWMPLIFYPISIPFLFLVRLIQILLLSIITLTACKVFKISLDYKAILRITMIAMIPVLLIDLAIIHIPFGNSLKAIVFIFLSVGYIIFATNALRSRPPGGFAAF